MQVAWHFFKKLSTHLIHISLFHRFWMQFLMKVHLILQGQKTAVVIISNHFFVWCDRSCAGPGLEYTHFTNDDVSLKCTVRLMSTKEYAYKYTRGVCIVHGTHILYTQDERTSRWYPTCSGRTKLLTLVNVCVAELGHKEFWLPSWVMKPYCPYQRSSVLMSRMGCVVGRFRRPFTRRSDHHK